MSLLPVKDAISGWRLAPETPPPAAWWPQSVLLVSMLDEITGQPPTLTPLASTTTQGLLARASGALAGLVGQPLQEFLPGFVTAVPLQLMLYGSGFLPVTLTAAIGAEAGYRNSFVPVDLGTVALHRDPITISGRTVSRTHVVRVGATVSLAGFWLTLADLANPPAAPNLITLTSPLYADRDTTGTIASQPLTAATTKTLLQPANVGDTAIRLSDQVGLAVGSIIAFDPQDPGRAEYLAVTGITALGAGPTFPAIVALAFPLIRPHVLGATAVQMIPGAAGAANPLSAAGRAGDVTLLPSAMTGLAAANAPVVIAGGGAAAEFHLASPIDGTSDASGYVTLPPVHRVAQLQLRVHHPVETTDLLSDVMLPLGSTTLTLDFVFP